MRYIALNPLKKGYQDNLDSPFWSHLGVSDIKTLISS